MCFRGNLKKNQCNSLVNLTSVFPASINTLSNFFKTVLCTDLTFSEFCQFFAKPQKVLGLDEYGGNRILSYSICLSDIRERHWLQGTVAGNPRNHRESNSMKEGTLVKQTRPTNVSRTFFLFLPLHLSICLPFSLPPPPPSFFIIVKVNVQWERLTVLTMERKFGTLKQENIFFFLRAMLAQWRIAIVSWSPQSK